MQSEPLDVGSSGSPSEAGSEPAENGGEEEFTATLREELETEELAHLVARSIRGGITSDIPSNYSVSVEGKELVIWMRAETLKKLRKMQNSYSDSIKLVKETVTRFSTEKSGNTP